MMQTTADIQKLKRKRRAKPVSSQVIDASVSSKKESGEGIGVPLFLQRFLSKNQTAPSSIQLQTKEEEKFDKTTTVFPKLTVGAPNDEYEKTADRVADKVMHIPDTKGSQLKEEEQSVAGNQPNLQTKSNGSFAASSKISKTIQSPGSGSPLSENVQSKVEPVLGSDLSNVRVHSDTHSNQMARSINAKAFTHQNHIWLGSGESANNLELIAHETTHVVQQTNKHSDLENGLQRRTDYNFGLLPPGWEGGWYGPRRVVTRDPSEIPIELTVVDESDVVGWMSSAVRFGEISVTSVADMVQKVIDAAEGRPIKQLNIIGHGSPGDQGVGIGTGTDEVGNRSISLWNLPMIEGILRRLIPHFAENALVVLEGCQVAKGDEGLQLLMELSSLWGVRVRAASANQRPLIPGLEGKETTCSPTSGGVSVCYEESDFWEPFE